MLFIVFFLVENDVAIDKKVVEQEKLTGFGLFSASLCENTFAHQDPTRNL
jgi:hypothetical protein